MHRKRYSVCLSTPALTEPVSTARSVEFLHGSREEEHLQTVALTVPSSFSFFSRSLGGANSSPAVLLAPLVLRWLCAALIHLGVPTMTSSLSSLLPRKMPDDQRATSLT